MIPGDTLPQHPYLGAPFRFVDKILTRSMTHGTMLKNVTANEWSTCPQMFLLPTLLLEAMVQAAGLQDEFLQNTETPQPCFLVRIPHAAFHFSPRVGDQILLKVTVERSLTVMQHYAVRAEVEQRLAASVELVLVRYPWR